MAKIITHLNNIKHYLHKLKTNIMENSCGECGKTNCPYCEDVKRIKQLQKANPEILNNPEKTLQELHDKTWWSHHDLLCYRMANDAIAKRMIQNNKSGKSLLQIFRSL